MRSVLENDKTTIENGKLLSESINKGISSFTPSSIFEHIVKNYKMAQNILGESIIRKLTGYESGTIEKNIKLPEFQRELLSKIEEKFTQLKDEKLIDKEGSITERGIDLASLILYTEELDKIAPQGISGERPHKKFSLHGEKDEIKIFSKDRYRDISVRKTIRKAILRGHVNVEMADLMSYKRLSKGEKYVIFGIDASGSMKGEKLEKSKKAGIALAFKAIDEKDHAGLIVFGTGIKASIPPTQDFNLLLREITRTRASAQTNIAETIKESINLFPKKKATKHLILITDALPTKGDRPEQDTIESAAIASESGVTISLIGIKLDDKGTDLAEKITHAGGGNLYIVKDLKELDKIVLLDYYRT